ncbi:MAG: calcium-binding protein, partial [Leisingera sp.]
MLWLASVLGLVAVGRSGRVETGASENEETAEGPEPGSEDGGLDGGYIEPGSVPDELDQPGDLVTGIDGNDILTGT